MTLSSSSNNKVVMAGLDPATQGHALKQRPWVAGSMAGHDEDVR
jgi:hypothetical protein